MAQPMLLRHNSSMPKIIPQTELDAIVEIVNGISEPVSLEQIFSHLQDRRIGSNQPTDIHTNHST